MKRTESQKSI